MSKFLKIKKKNGLWYNKNIYGDFYTPEYLDDLAYNLYCKKHKMKLLYHKFYLYI